MSYPRRWSARNVDPEVEEEPAYDATKPLRIAVVGRPNAGKSTLINALIGEERMLTGPEAGITRNSISVDWDLVARTPDRRLFDTAGMRRKAKVQEKLEKLSVADALRAIRFAEVVIIVLDAHHSPSRNRICRSPTSSSVSGHRR